MELPSERDIAMRSKSGQILGINVPTSLDRDAEELAHLGKRQLLKVRITLRVTIMDHLD